MSLVTLNAGSSSLKVAVFSRDGGERRLSGHLDRREEGWRFTLRRQGGGEERRELGAAATRADALDAALEALGEAAGETVHAVSHRVVHGGVEFAAPVIIDDQVRARLKALIPLAPLHQPHNLAAVRAAETAFPGAVQVACFDTAFHHGHAFEAEAFAIPRRYFDAGVRRYGFHGLSYEYLTGALSGLAEPAPSRVVFAHLGAGASLCAVRDGRSVDTTMGFSALDGLPMATRCGQIDPGVLLHLIETEGLDAAALSELLYRESGLKGLSGLSGDMRVLEASHAAEAKQAIGYFIERCRRQIAALAAALQGLDALVFAGGMGENSPAIRADVCAGLAWLGVELDAGANAAARGAAARISTDASPVQVWMIPTDEEAVLARAAARLVAG
ncbi:MAG: acetate/propionate family kinase [Alphaproteobacteria bacterium]|nr:acetate/propionate family kinase [Alphaproteobacteria bacterium]